MVVAGPRLTGLAYLVLGVFAALGYMVIRGKLYVAGDPGQTAANLVKREGLARAGIACDLAGVGQALAVWFFFALFRRVHAVLAASIAAFGLVSAAAMLVAAAFSSTALEVALDGSATSARDADLLYRLQGASWQVAALFFGLWLVPMGWYLLVKGVSNRVPYGLSQSGSASLSGGTRQRSIG